MEEGFKKSPMAQLIQEYSLVTLDSQLGRKEMNITLVLSLEELTPDLEMKTELQLNSYQ